MTLAVYVIVNSHMGPSTRAVAGQEFLKGLFQCMQYQNVVDTATSGINTVHLGVFCILTHKVHPAQRFLQAQQVGSPESRSHYSIEL